MDPKIDEKTMFLKQEVMDEIHDETTRTMEAFVFFMLPLVCMSGVLFFYVLACSFGLTDWTWKWAGILSGGVILLYFFLLGGCALTHKLVRWAEKTKPF